MHQTRLTPTCVGRTASRLPHRAWGAAHPHVRGEDPAPDLVSAAAGGSPPRAWGGRRRGHGRRAQVRLTPTCVGRTARTRCWSRRGAAHPHVRGEDPVLPEPVPGLPGSPPRAWGGHRGDPLGFRGSRLTPTCVGRTVDQERLRPGLRLTPTCVGRTSRPRAPPEARAAHPHVRGEDCPSPSSTTPDTGSPPRAWGGLGLDFDQPRPQRLTPTCVGRTCRTPHPLRRPTAHPHVRGEDVPMVRWTYRFSGSPPRAWGGRPRHLLQHWP